MLRHRESPHAIRHGRHSLFFKLFAILLITGLLSHMAVGSFFRFFWNSGAREAGEKNLRHYARLLIREIGIPPDTVAAARMSRELGLTIAIHGPDSRWASPDFPERAWVRLQSHPGDDSIRLRLTRHGRLVALAKRDGYVFGFGSRIRQPLESRALDWLTLFGALSLVWLLAWLTLRHLLRPVRGLAAGVAAVRAGDLDLRLPEKGRGELSELARSFNAMAQSLKERLRARDQLLLDVSHELRSPLTRMRVELEMAPPGPEIEGLRDEVDVLEKMVTEILETERLQSGAGGLRKETVDLSLLIEKAIAGFAGRAPGVAWNAPGHPIPVPADPERMGWVLRNLIENAMKYGADAKRPVDISLGKEDPHAVIRVRDYGPGIPEEEQRLVFEPFYRVDRSRSRAPGYGLGLSLCKNVVHTHGGVIGLESKVGEGTTVTVKLPLAG